MHQVGKIFGIAPISRDFRGSPRGASPANSVVPFGSMVERRRALDQRGGTRLRLHQLKTLRTKITLPSTAGAA